MNTALKTLSPSEESWNSDLDGASQLEAPQRTLSDPPPSELNPLAAVRRREDLGMSLVATSEASGAMPKGFRGTLSLKTIAATRAPTRLGKHGRSRS
jgi:hypothetical protein